MQISFKPNLNRVLTGLAILGILGAIYMVIRDKRPVPYSQPLTPPSVSPYESFIAGAGIVEAASDNIGLGTMVAAVVEEILVKKGQLVSKGTPLIKLDSRQVKADLEVKKSQYKAALASLEQAKSSLKYAQDEYDMVTFLEDKRGVSKEEIIIRKNNVVTAEKAVDVAEGNAEAAKHQADESQVILDFYTVKTPLDCEIMQINIHPGEYAPTAEFTTTPLMLVGDVNKYHVRVDIDENDAWRFQKDQPAVVFLRGNVQYHTDLNFVYFEPYVIPKQSLTGDSTERVDTRVLQVVYSYDPKTMPAYLGQEVDVYIKAQPVSSDARYGGPLPVSR